MLVYWMLIEMCNRERDGLVSFIVIITENKSQIPHPGFYFYTSVWIYYISNDSNLQQNAQDMLQDFEHVSFPFNPKN